MSILFWSQEQEKLMRMFRQGMSGIMVGDYGCGKTVLLTAMAKQECQNSRVIYIPSLAGAEILNISMTNKFQETSVEVWTLSKIREDFEEETSEKDYEEETPEKDYEEKTSEDDEELKIQQQGQQGQLESVHG